MLGYSQWPLAQLQTPSSHVASGNTQASSLSQVTGLHSLPMKLLELPLQQAGQLRNSALSGSTLSWKHAVDSLEHALPAPSHVTELDTTGEVWLVRSSNA
jgi:hypothetical protein